MSEIDFWTDRHEADSKQAGGLIECSECGIIGLAYPFHYRLAGLMPRALYDARAAYVRAYSDAALEQGFGMFGRAGTDLALCPKCDPLDWRNLETTHPGFKADLGRMTGLSDE